MSTRFTIYCADCDATGPHIRRHHSTAIFMERDSARFFPVSDERAAADEWGAFLSEHEYHDLSLHIRSPLLVRREREEAQRAWEEANRPTHRLLADGSLEEL